MSRQPSWTAAAAFILSLLAAMMPAAHANIPLRVNYQGFLVDAANQPVTGSVSMVFRIYDAPAGGGLLYTEPQTVAVSNGLFNVQIGAVTALTLPFDQPYFLGTTIAPDVAEMTPRQPLTSSPYAYQARSTLSLASGVTISGSQIANGAVTSDKLATGAVALANLGTTGCTAGESLLFDGTAWACRKSLVPRPSQASTTIAGGGSGKHSSLVIGVDGLPLIAYYDQTNKVLKTAHCENIECTSATTSTIDATTDAGQHVSLAIGSQGLGAISYYDATNTALKVALCQNIACSAATLFTVDPNNDAGQYTSIAFFSASPWISYYDATLKDLKLAQCNTTISCDSPTIVTVASTGNVGEWTALTLATEGVRTFVIAFYDATAHLVRLATCISTIANCASPTLITVDSLGANVAEGIALTTGNNGAPVLSYVSRVAGGSGSKRIAVCESIACAAPVVTSVGSTSSTLARTTTSVSIGIDGFPVAAFSPNITGGNCEATSGSSTSFGSFTKCLDSTCTLSSFETPQSTAVAPSLAIGVDGAPIMSVWSCGPSALNTGLKVVHCGSPDCQPAFRRR